MKKTADDVRSYVERIAGKHDWKLVANREMLDHLVNGLLENFNRYGYYNCPCRDSQNDRKKDRDIICPCDYRNPDIEEYGQCYCALYVRKDVHEGKTALQPIPERRPANKQSRAYKIHNKPAKILIKRPGKSKESAKIKLKLYYCKQCGYICFREDPPYICPICKAKENMFAELSVTPEIHEII